MSTSDPASSRSTKRAKLEERPKSQASQKHKKGKKVIDTNYYDPDQDPEERRTVKKSMRGLLSELQDSKAEYLQPDSRGLVETLTQSDRLFKDVKQTSDATIDARLLVATADLSYKKVRTMTLGDSSVGVDVDDFVNKCVVFMKKGGAAAAPSNTQSQRRRRQEVDDDDEDGDNGDAMNWAHLGREACFLYNSRPCLSGFLLGPLSVQKKVRQQTQRRAREARADPSQALRPIEVQQQDIDNQQVASLTSICREIEGLLDRTIKNGRASLQEVYDGSPPEEQAEYAETRNGKMRTLMRQHHLANTGGVPLFDFVVNPKSFGQTVENMFYVSFLIKENRAGLEFDSDGLPTLLIPDERGVAEKHDAGVQRNQAIFTMSFDIWEDLVKSFGIKECIIPHRKDDHKYDDGVLDLQRERAEGAPRREQVEDEDSDLYG